MHTQKGDEETNSCGRRWLDGSASNGSDRERLTVGEGRYHSYS